MVFKQSTLRYIRYIYVSVAVFMLLCLPYILFAAEDKVFKPMVDIPYLNEADFLKMSDPNSKVNPIGLYVEAIFKLAIAAAAFLAVVRITLAGVKYMMSDIVTDKGEAKKDIQGALLGLLIVLAAFLILNTINPQLVNLQALQNADFACAEGVACGGGRLDFFDNQVVKEGMDPGTYAESIQCATEDCSTEIQDCKNTPGYIVYEVTPNGMNCYTESATISPGQYEEQIVNEELKKIMDDNNYTTIVQEYDVSILSSLSDSEVNGKIEEWTDDCEGNFSDNQNELIEIGPSTPTLVACVGP